MIDRQASGLFGGHVFRRADHDAASHVPRLAEDAGDPEVGQLDVESAPGGRGEHRLARLRSRCTAPWSWADFRSKEHLTGDRDRVLPGEAAA